MIKRVLKLDVGGRPVSWITREEGALMYCRDQVAWEAGMEHIVLRGGYVRATGARSFLLVSTIVAAHGIHRQIDLLNGVSRVQPLQGGQAAGRDRHAPAGGAVCT